MGKKKVLCVVILVIIGLIIFQGNSYGMITIINKFEKYEGVQSGSTVKVLISEITNDNIDVYRHFKDYNNYTINDIRMKDVNSAFYSRYMAFVKQYNPIIRINFLGSDETIAKLKQKKYVVNDICPNLEEYRTTFTKKQIDKFKNSANILKNNLDYKKQYTVFLYNFSSITPAEILIIENGIDEEIIINFKKEIDERREKEFEEFKTYSDDYVAGKIVITKEKNDEEIEDKSLLDFILQLPLFIKNINYFIKFGVIIILLVILVIVIIKQHKKKAEDK